jgi:thymidylate kinase
MTSITLIGPDGAGKTTITRRLETSGLLPFKYLYMGVSITSSNTALFTSRLAERFKRRSRGAAASSHGESTEPSRRGKVGVRHRLRAAARLTNRLADAWFRQGLSWYYQLRGMVVLYDRHFVFDFAPEITVGTADSLEKRLQRWCLTRLYPSPDLVIFLDAPGEVLFARKGELSPAELERRRQGFLRQGERLPNFVRVDATRPLEVVYQEVAEHIVKFQRRMPLAAPASAA